MADSSNVLSADRAPLIAEHILGTVYAIDLKGFSTLTQARIQSDARYGTEEVSRLVADLFGRLMTELAARNIQFGGFAGDALIAWAEGEDAALSSDELANLAIQICQDTAPDLSCRAATATGQFWRGEIDTKHGCQPLIWGAPVRAAFEALATRASGHRRESHANDAAAIRPAPLLAAASVTDRWTVVMRIASNSELDTVTPEALSATIERTREICTAHAAEIDNVVQDDKGLLVIIILPPSQSHMNADRDALLSALTTGRAPIAPQNGIASDFGTVFRFRPQIAEQLVPITIGVPVNSAAKSLDRASPSAWVETPRATDTSLAAPTASPPLIGRLEECQRLRQAYDQAKAQRHCAVVIGPAGIGKTRLFQDLRRDVEAKSIIVEVTPGSRLLPFGCAQDLAEALDLPARAVFDTDGQALLAEHLPPLIIIENWQWCDEDSKRLLRRLHAERASGLLLISSRETVDDITAETEIRLSALDAAESDTLIEQLAPGRLSAALKSSIYDLTSGTPFWLVQAAFHFGTASSEETVSGLENLLSARAQHLSAPALALWRLYCAWRLPMAFAQAQSLLQKFDIRIFDEHFEALDRLGWLVEDENGHRPAHDILADWGVADLPVTFERALHAAIARAVSASKGSPSRIAGHWQKADQDIRAAIWFDRAAQRADQAGSHQLTLTHLEQSETLARDATHRNPIRDLDRLALACTAHWGIGKLRRAKQELMQFDAVAKTVQASSRKRIALQRAAAIKSEVGQFAGNSDLILSGIYHGWRNRGDVAGAYEVKSRRQGFVLYTLGLLRLPVDGHLKRLIKQAHARGEYRSEALLGGAASTLHIKRCEWHQAEAILSTCYNAIAQTDDRQMLGVIQCLLGLNALFQGDTGRAHDWFDHLSLTGREQDHQMFNVWGAYAKAEALLYDDELRLAEAQAQSARAMAKGLGDHQSFCIIEGVLAQVYAQLGVHEAAFRHARNALRFAAKLPPSNFSTLEGIAAPAQVGALLQRAGYRPSEVEDLIEGGRKALRAYARVFKMAQPRQAFVEGLIAQADAKSNRARRQFRKAVAAADICGMARERALAETALAEIEESRDGATTEIY